MTKAEIEEQIVKEQAALDYAIQARAKTYAAHLKRYWSRSIRDHNDIIDALEHKLAAHDYSD
jgi:hypothetical protein